MYCIGSTLQPKMVVRDLKDCPEFTFSGGQGPFGY